jgi:uncharacterized protein YecE (DUF72 family)
VNAKHKTTRKGIYIGTSGWSYDHWKGPFYPDDLSNDHMLAYYSRHFSSVEINSSFYHLPQKHTLKHWRNTVPKDFLFTAKVSRYVTHMKKLKDPEESVSAFLERISTLEDKLGPILFQLPPRWHFNAERLSALLRTLSRDFRYTFEFRDKSWINEETYELLSRYNAAFCVYDLDGYLSPKKITTDFVYIRLHGPDGPYQGSYATRTLSSWASAFSTWSKQGLNIYCYFDNDEAGFAAKNANRLQAMLQKKAGEN